MAGGSVSEKVGTWFTDVDRVVSGQILSPENLAQAPAIFITLLAATAIARLAEPLLRRVVHEVSVDAVQEQFYLDHLFPLRHVVFWIVGLWLSTMAAAYFGWPHGVILIAIKLAGAWLIIRFATAMLTSVVLGQVVAVLVWAAAALSILGILEPLREHLDSITFTLGSQRVSLLRVFEGLLTMAVLLWVSMISARFISRRIQSVTELTPSARVLFGKVSTIVLLSVAFVLSLGIVGIDFTALAVFTGAVGVGIGFGLQRTVSNLFAGIILLLDKSIKPGDIIEVGGTYGWVTALGARYVEVETRDGTQFLIPNEDIITQRVFNWTHQHDRVRLKLPVRVAYGSDLRLALKLMKEAGGRRPRVLKVPVPNPVAIGFGENGVDLELRFWIADVQNGIHNISSEVLLEICDLFAENGIQVPLPQRQIRVLGDEVISPPPLADPPPTPVADPPVDPPVVPGRPAPPVA